MTTIIELCYECYDDHVYVLIGFAGAAQAEKYVSDLVEARAIVKCPQCKRVVDYGKER